MRCHCKRSGPFIPTIEQVEEAARRLPNPTRKTPHVMYSYVPQPMPRCRIDRFDDLACNCTLPTLQFELRANVDEYGSTLYGWMYSGGVRV